MRFGKNFVFLCIGKNLATKGSTIIMLTSRPEVFTSLRDDIKGHVYFNDFNYCELKEIGESFVPMSDKINVLAISTQLLNNQKNKDKYKELLSNLNCILLGLDEASNGILTDVSQDIIDSINSKHTIYIDGTPWKIEATGKFNEKNSYFYDHIDRMKDYKAGIDKRAVQMEWRMIKVLDKITEDSVWYSDEEGFTLTKLFSFNDETDSLVHEGHVVTFTKCILGIIPKTSFSPYKMVDLNHTIWLLPKSVKAIKELKRIIESISDEYKVFAATDGDVDMDDIKTFIKYNPNVKTITLTLGSLTRGTTLPQWDGAFMLCDTTSAELYFQSSFRVSTEHTNKTTGYVFDFDPNRTIEMLYDYVYKSVDRKGITNPVTILEELYDNFNIYHLPNGVTFEKFDIESMLNKIRDANLAAHSLRKMKDYIDIENIENINDKKLNEFLSSYGKTKSPHFVAEFSLNSNFKKGKNKKMIKGGVVVNSENKQKAEWIARIQSLCSKLPLMTELGFSTIESIINNMDDLIFLEATSIEKEVLKKLIEYKIINPTKINLRLV